MHRPLVSRSSRVMSTSRIYSVLMWLLIIAAPSIAQQPTATTLQPSSTLSNELTMQASTTSILTSSLTTRTEPMASSLSTTTSNLSSTTDLPLPLIIGCAVGGGVLLCAILSLCICVCICCAYRRVRRNKAFNPSVSEKLPVEVGSPVYRTLTPPKVHSNLDKKEEFQMQVNVAHAQDVTVELEEHTVKPSQLFVKKSASSSNIHETKFNGDLQRTSTNSAAVSNSIINTEQPPEMKGYVQMSSAGSVHPSRSLGDITSGVEEQDTGIYVEPDRTGATLLIQAESFRDPPPTTTPPMLHPKTASMTAEASSPSHKALKPTLPPTLEVRRLESEEYVATDIFRIDRQTQEEIDSYYNKDTIESIRQGRGLSDVIDPSDALYTSVDSSSSTPAHQSNLIIASADDHLRNKGEFLRERVVTQSPAQVAVAVPGEGDVEEEGYYNVKHHTGSDDEDTDDYYNSVQGLGTGSKQPLIDPEDDQYVYIENSNVPQPIAPAAVNSGKPTVATKPRHLSEPTTNQPNKYINLGPNQRQVLQEKAQASSKSPSKKSKGDPAMSNGLSNGGSGVSDDVESEDQPLYENLREEEEEEEGGREIYENIAR